MAKNLNLIRRQSSDITFYWQYYDLNRDPFSIIPDDTMAYLLPKWELHIDLIQHMIQTKNVLLALIGVKGSGKSTLINVFTKQVGDSMVVNFVNGSHHFGLEQLIDSLSEGFKLPKQDGQLLEDKLDSMIADIQYQARPCLLIIDDAQDLPEETLQALIYLLKQQSDNQMRLHFILAGDQYLQAKLAKLAHQEQGDECIHSIELEPLTFDETRQYLQHRLMVAGLKESLPLSLQMLENIHNMSLGLPEHINRFGQQVLLDNIAKQQSTSSLDFYHRHQTKILGGALLAVTLVMTSMVLTHNSDKQQVAMHQQQINKNIANLKANIKKEVIAANANAIKPQPQTMMQPAQNAGNLNQATNVPPMNVAKNNPGVQIASADANRTQSDESAKLLMNPSVTHIKFEEDAAAVATEPANNAEAANNMEVASNSQTNKDVNNAEGLANLSNAADGSTDVNTSHSTNADESTVSTASDHASDTTADATSKTAGSTSTGESTSAESSATHEAKADFDIKDDQLKYSHIVKADPKHWTLQVIGLSNQDSLKKFVKKHGLQDQVRYYVSHMNGKPWYVVLYGDYTSKTDAAKNLSSLPKSVQDCHPWPRTIASVQQSMQRAEQNNNAGKG